ncbi:MAG: PspC domain-containing protein [Chloroflexota bacterium]|nr:PspC domain-containing protein [Chloroflexota bacterium]MDE3101195.1 PspC domain-containing protein [Chloroflexota bacterium]
MQHRLERSATNRVLTGVCGGIGEYLVVDPTVVRIFFVIATVLTAFTFALVYIVLLILMPLPGQRALYEEWLPGSAAPPPGPIDPNAPAPPRPTYTHDPDRARNGFGIALIALGLIFLLSNLGAFRFVQWQLVWPLVIIALGALLLASRARS